MRTSVVVGLVVSGVTAFPLAMVVPFAFIAGSIRGIPVGWQLIDMSFGVLGVIPLIIAYRRTQRLAAPAASRPVPDTGLEALPGRAQL